MCGSSLLSLCSQQLPDHRQLLPHTAQTDTTATANIVHRKKSAYKWLRLTSHSKALCNSKNLNVEEKRCSSMFDNNVLSPRSFSNAYLFRYIPYHNQLLSWGSVNSRGFAPDPSASPTSLYPTEIRQHPKPGSHVAAPPAQTYKYSKCTIKTPLINVSEPFEDRPLDKHTHTETYRSRATNRLVQGVYKAN